MASTCRCLGACVTLSGATRSTRWRVAIGLATVTVGPVLPPLIAQGGHVSSGRLSDAKGSGEHHHQRLQPGRIRHMFEYLVTTAVVWRWRARWSARGRPRHCHGGSKGFPLRSSMCRGRGGSGGDAVRVRVDAEVEVGYESVSQILGGEIVQRRAGHESLGDRGDRRVLVVHVLHELRQRRPVTLTS
jgi:hypothetical protein